MKITILGSGTGFPSLERGAPGFHLLQGGEGGRETLVDCGGGAMRRMLEAGLSPDNLDDLFFTHIHPDHVGDLIPLIHALKGVKEREKPLVLTGPTGFSEFVEQCVFPVASRPKRFDVEIRTAADDFLWGGASAASRATVHSSRMASRAYRFTSDKGASAVFSGDCGSGEGVTELAAGADLLVIECSSVNDKPFKGHLTAGMCGRIAHEAGVRRVVLTHLTPDGGPLETRLAECREAFSGEVVLGSDLMAFEL